MSRIYKNRSRYRKNSPDKERCVILGEYIIETGGTVREAAARFGISKSTVHTVVTKQNGPRGRKLKPPKRINKGIRTVLRRADFCFTENLEYSFAEIDFCR